MPRPRMSASDELRYCKNALADALAERDALAATLQRVRALIPQWERDRVTYPDTDAGRYARAAVKLCGEELEAALASPGDHTPEAGDA